MYNNDKNDFEKFVALYLAEQDKRNEELRDRDIQLRSLRIINTVLTALLLISLTVIGWLYLGKNQGVFVQPVPKDAQYTQITLDELKTMRKNNLARTKYDCVGQLYSITGNIDKINDDLKHITLLNPDDFLDRTTYKFNIGSDELRSVLSAYNAGDRISLNCKCVSVGRFAGFEFDIIEIPTEESEYTAVRLSALNEARRSDSGAARTQYEGKKLVTEGAVESIDKGLSYFTLTDTADTSDKTEYKFYVPAELQQSVVILSKGQTVRVKCQCTSVGFIQGYEFVLEEIFTDPQEYTDILMSQLSYEYSEDFAAAAENKGRFFKFKGLYESAANDMSYITLKNPENSYDRTVYKIYLNNSEQFRQQVNDLVPGREITVSCQCRDVIRFKGYEFDLKAME
ncbi:MAG: hypothetical protein IKS17_04455 [Firmicutes bacterium]|nr:hypothetical protein [Bacillota bacterium]